MAISIVAITLSTQWRDKVEGMALAIRKVGAREPPVSHLCFIVYFLNTICQVYSTTTIKFYFIIYFLNTISQVYLTTIILNQ